MSEFAADVGEQAVEAQRQVAEYGVNCTTCMTRVTVAGVLGDDWEEVLQTLATADALERAEIIAEATSNRTAKVVVRNIKVGDSLQTIWALAKGYSQCVTEPMLEAHDIE